MKSIHVGEQVSMIQNVSISHCSIHVARILVTNVLIVHVYTCLLYMDTTSLVLRLSHVCTDVLSSISLSHVA